MNQHISTYKHTKKWKFVDSKENMCIYVQCSRKHGNLGQTNSIVQNYSI